MTNTIEIDYPSAANALQPVVVSSGESRTQEPITFPKALLGRIWKAMP
jgi:hypothetical protein